MVIRYAEPWGLQRDALGSFDSLVSEGWERNHAAWGALYDWDLLEHPEGDDARV
tara:strand:+ start:747 stop:908 length:162 start_codon:yes stop_codon:yes gene_type:complete